MSEATETPKTDALSGTFYLRCDDCERPEKCERMVSVSPEDYATLERENASLLKRVEEAEKDAERLDWLDTHCVEVRKPLRYGTRAVFYATVGEDDETCGIRAKVDAARRAGKE